jgi:AhpD family alkylhydroperoxidase
MNAPHTPAATAPRLDYMQLSAELFKKYLAFSMANKMDEGLAILIDIRASQLNGCAFCVDMHVKQAKIHGERELRLHHIAIWRESNLFSAKERAAFAWTEALTKASPEGHLAVSDELFESMLDHFSETELSDLTFRIAAINGWNRMGIAFRNPPGSKDQMFGLSKAGLS